VKSRKALRAVFLVLLLLPILSGYPSQNLPHSEEVSRALERFIQKERSFIQGGLSNSSLYLPFIREVFQREKLPQELVWLPLIESGFSVHAHSRTGAVGLWQFMPATARLYRMRIDFWIDERLDPFSSTEKAAKHLKDLYQYYQDWNLVLAAYNAGMGAVNRAIIQGKTRDYWQLCTKKLLRRETREYVPRFYAAVLISQKPGAYGFDWSVERNFPDFMLLESKKPVDLTIFARKTGMELGELKFLNPELKRNITPLGEAYVLRIPIDAFSRALAVYRNLPEKEIYGLTWHTVRTGETLGDIARKYSTDVALLQQINAIKWSSKILAGKKILVPVGTEVAVPHQVKCVLKKGFSTQEIEYTVREGDTIWEIARVFRTDMETIFTLNELSYESVIVPGDRIILWTEIAFQR
jgi:membrane-bound lytic murein transglycosylase D